MSKGKRRAIKKLKSIPRCGLCGAVGRLRRTECCGNLICDDWEKYVLFSFAPTSCSRNHDRQTLCGYHHNEGHSGKWKDCPACRDGIDDTELYVHFGTNEFNFERLTVIPEFEPSRCSECGRRIFLGLESYTAKGDDRVCADCQPIVDFNSFRPDAND